MGLVKATCGPGKIDQWKKGLRLHQDDKLWPESFWKRLCEVANADWKQKFSEECVVMIKEVNELLY